MLPELNRLPARVRPVAFETVDSYARRLRTANGISLRLWGYWLKPAIRATAQPTHEAWETVLEAVGRLEEGHFARDRSRLPVHDDGTTCSNCVTGIEGRFGCMRCTRGVAAEQVPHDGPRVCRRHMQWVGPGTSPEEQFTVGTDVLRADELYRRLRRQGVLDSHRLEELMGCTDMWTAAEGAGSVTRAERFRFAVELAHRVVRPERLEEITDRTRDVAARYTLLSDLVVTVAGGRDCAVLVDALWMMFRTASHQTAANPHAFEVHAVGENFDDSQDIEQMRTCAYPRATHLHISQYVSSLAPGTRFARARNSHTKNAYVCGRGHRFQTVPNALHRSKNGVGCAVCAGRRFLPGFNSLADTHPDIAGEWHPTANGDLRPQDVMAGSSRTVVWLCEAAGHTFPKSLNSRTRGAGCGYCANKLVDPRTNALSLTHPHIAAGWHTTRNGDLTPDDVVAGSERSVWWRCEDAGHEYEMLVSYRTRGHKCVYCRRQRAHKSTSLAVSHPKVAARWLHEKNGRVTPADVLHGTGKKFWWRCAADEHDYFASVESQSRGHGCPFCTRRLVHKSNCMSMTHPALALEFHRTKNGALTPDTIVASTTRALWWSCSRGHEWRTTGSLRARQGTGCPFCANRRVWVGWNDMATTHPQLAAEWDDGRNGDLRPTDVVAGTNKLIAWKCASQHTWRAKANNRVKGSGCPDCWRESFQGG